MRQPYGRDIASTVVYAHPVWFARHGYHVVIQDVRGRGGSEGDFYPFRHEGRDGAETIAWLRGHAACNGRIGMYGFSYQGATQLLAAAEQPEGLQCIAPHMTAADLYHGWFYHQGALRLSSALGWGIQMLREDARRATCARRSDRLEAAWANVRTQAMQAPYADHPAISDPALPSYVRDWFAHREPGEYWAEQDISTRIDRIQIPALHIAGWYDTYLEGSIAGYLALRKGAGTEFAREHQYLFVGPWVHIPWGDRAGDASLGDAANLNTDEILLRWFNHWLKDTAEFSFEARVRYFRLGINNWRGAHDWNEESAHALSAQRWQCQLAQRRRASLRYDARGAKSQRDVFVYDPEVPVMAPGGPQALSGPFDQAGLEMGNNLLVYTSEPVQQPTEVFGQPRVKLYAATSAAHADFIAKLVRVTATGRAEFLCIGIARSSWLFREAPTRPMRCTRGSSRWSRLRSCSRRANRLRLEIASSAFPLYDRNPSTDVAAATGRQLELGALDAADSAHA